MCYGLENFGMWIFIFIYCLNKNKNNNLNVYFQEVLCQVFGSYKNEYIFILNEIIGLLLMKNIYEYIEDKL